MSETFTPLAQSRASYYCKGSPVHFSMVELFRMESTGSTVVTLTFKNLYSHPIQKFTAHFRCKNRQGEVIGEDDFDYCDVQAGEGESFGFDDAVFVCDEPLGSVEVNLVSVTYDDGILHSLRRCPPVALPPLRPLDPAQCASVCATLGNSEIRYCPEEVEDGWRCGCGAFNYNAGHGKHVCSECGADRTLLLAAVHDAQRASRPQRPMYDAGMQFLPVQDEAVPAQGGARRDDGRQYAVRTLRGAAAASVSAPAAAVSLMRDETALRILRFAPLVTGGLVMLIAAGAAAAMQMIR